MTARGVSHATDVHSRSFAASLRAWNDVVLVGCDPAAEWTADAADRWGIKHLLLVFVHVFPEFSTEFSTLWKTLITTSNRYLFIRERVRERFVFLFAALFTLSVPNTCLFFCSFVLFTLGSPCLAALFAAI